MKIELLFESTCPNAEGARKLLMSVREELGLSVNIIEINKDDPASPGHARNFASPTVLINGIDVVPEENPGGNACRVYRTPDGLLSGLPPRDAVLRAIERARRSD